MSSAPLLRCSCRVLVPPHLKAAGAIEEDPAVEGLPLSVEGAEPCLGADIPGGPSGGLFRALTLYGFMESGGAEALILAIEEGSDPEDAAELLAKVVYLSGVLLPLS